MNPEELEGLLRELVQAVTLVIQSGEEISDEFQGILAQTLSRLVERIDESRAQQTEAPIIPSELPAATHASSQINSFKYDPKNQDLFIKYQDKYPGQNGPVYRYSGVPKFIYDVFSRGAVPPRTSGRNDWHEWKEGVTPSLGAAANYLVKAGGFPYQRVA